MRPPKSLTNNYNYNNNNDVANNEDNNSNKSNSGGYFHFTVEKKPQIPYERLAECFSMRLVDAAKQLGISVSSLTYACRNYGIKRWPYMKIQSMKKAENQKQSNNPRPHKQQQRTQDSPRDLVEYSSDSSNSSAGSSPQRWSSPEVEIVDYSYAPQYQQYQHNHNHYHHRHYNNHNHNYMYQPQQYYEQQQQHFYQQQQQQPQPAHQYAHYTAAYYENSCYPPVLSLPPPTVAPAVPAPAPVPASVPTSTTTAGPYSRPTPLTAAPPMATTTSPPPSKRRADSPPPKLNNNNNSSSSSSNRLPSILELLNSTFDNSYNNYSNQEGLLLPSIRHLCYAAGTTQPQPQPQQQQQWCRT